MVIQRENSCCWKPSQKNRTLFHEQGLSWETGSCTRHTSQSHRTPIMLGGLILIAGGLISNRDEGHFRQSARAVRNVSISACAVRNVSAPTAVCSPLDESQGHSITKRRVPNKGTSATRAVAWGSVGRLIDPQISKSTTESGSVGFMCAPVRVQSTKFLGTRYRACAECLCRSQLTRSFR